MATDDHHHVDLIPGTEVMGEVDDLDNGIFIPVPQPSSDPADPLNWSKRYKYMAIIAQGATTWVVVEAALSAAPMYPLLGAQFHLDNQQLALITGVNVITLAFGNLFIIPLSNIFGRRCISLVCTFLVLLTNVWQALAGSHSSFLAARACNGIVGATSESLMVQVIADVFFLRERGLWMSVYFTTYIGGASVGPIIAGNIAARWGWRSFYWLSLALTGFVLLLLLVSFPETKFHRPTTTSNSREVGSSTEKTLGDGKTDTIHVEAETSSPNEAATSHLGKGKPCRRQWRAAGKPDKQWASFLVRDLLTPFRLMLNPIIMWAALVVPGPANLPLLFNITESALFRSPPYNWSLSGVAYSNFAFFAGAMLGAISAGWSSDWTAQRSTKRNHGIREAEMRLPALIPFVVIFILSHIVGAIGYSRQWPWPVILIFGFGGSGVAVTAIPAISVAYAVDCFKPVSGEIMTVATIFKDVLGFAMSYWVFEVVDKYGWVTVFMIQFATAMFPLIFAVPLYIWGKNVRRLSKNSYIHQMESSL